MNDVMKAQRGAGMSDFLDIAPYLNNYKKHGPVEQPDEARQVLVALVDAISMVGVPFQHDMAARIIKALDAVGFEVVRKARR